MENKRDEFVSSIQVLGFVRVISRCSVLCSSLFSGYLAPYCPNVRDNLQVVLFFYSRNSYNSNFMFFSELGVCKVYD